MNRLSKIFYGLTAVALFFISPSIIAGYSNVFAAVVINEVFPKPSDPSNQWIELYNTGTDNISLNLWKIENTSNGGKSFIIPASGSIAPKGFYVLNRSQTAIPLSIDGDTIKLSDANNTVVDTESYPGTLGFNTSMGRMPDGTGAWIACAPTAPDGTYSATPNQPNNCPIATPTPTTTPTPIPTNSPIPTVTPEDTTTPTDLPPAIPTLTGIVQTTKMNISVTPTPSPGDVISIQIPQIIQIPKVLALQIAVVVGVWILLAFIALANNQYSRRRRKKIKPGPPNPPTIP